MRKSDLRLAKRYSRALFELYEHTVLDHIKWAFFSLRDTWLENTEIREALTNPSYPIAQRLEAIRELSHFLRGDDERFANFLILLLRNNRLQFIPEIASTFAGMVDELHSLLNITVVSAFPLSEQEKGDIVTRMRHEYSPMVSVVWEVNAALIGGLVIKAGDIVLDGSVQGSLDKIRKSLMM